MSDLYVQGKQHSNGNVDSSSVAATLDASVGNKGVVIVTVGFVDASVDVTSIIDDKGNTYTLSDRIANASAGYSIRMGAAYNVTNAPKVVTGNMASPGAFLSIVVDEFTGLDTSPVDGVSFGQSQDSPGTGTDAVSSRAMTTTTDGDLIYGSAVSTNSSGMSHGTGFTQRQNVINTFCTESLIQSKAGSIAATFTAGAGNDNTLAQVMAFKAAPVVPPAPTVGEKKVKSVRVIANTNNRRYRTVNIVTSQPTGHHRHYAQWSQVTAAETAMALKCYETVQDSGGTVPGLKTVYIAGYTAPN
jgi:hypothetical protein